MEYQMRTPHITRILALILILFSITFTFSQVPVQPVTASAQIVDAPFVQTDETKYIALTFDDGPRWGTTDRLLDGLQARGASATFFLVGEELAGKEELVQRMQDEGHQIGNHTWSHVHLETPDSVKGEVDQTEAALSKLLGGKSYWLRPPYGLVTEEVEAKISVPMVKWSIDPRDWESLNTASVTREILSAAKPNAIILLHDIYPTSVDAALQVVDALQQDGYLFVTVEELLLLNHITAQPGTLYRTGLG